MKNIIANSTFSIDYDESKSLAAQKWFGDLSEDEYKSNMYIWLDFVLSCEQVIKFNILYPNLDFTITIELQEWTNENITSITGHKGIEKVAVLVPQEVFDQIMISFLAIEQTMDETKQLFETRYFTSEEEAMNWFGI
jgi:hypothetical protein